jgi:hypothetical protein
MNEKNDLEKGNATGNHQQDSIDPSDISAQHQGLLKAYYGQIASKELELEEVSFVGSSHFDGMGSEEEGFFPKGLDMTIWNVNEEAVIIATTSDKEISFIQRLRRDSDGKSDSLDFGLVLNFPEDPITAARTVSPRIAHSRSQNLSGMIFNWANAEKNGNSKKSGDIYHQIAAFKVDGYTLTDAWWHERKVKDVLLLLTYRGMSKYRRAQGALHPNDPFIVWFEKNLCLN